MCSGGAKPCHGRSSLWSRLFAKPSNSCNISYWSQVPDRNVCFFDFVKAESMRSTVSSTTLWIIDSICFFGTVWGRKYRGVAACLHTWHLFMVTSLVMEKGSPSCSELQFKLWMARQLRSTVLVNSIAKMAFLGLPEECLVTIRHTCCWFWKSLV